VAESTDQRYGELSRGVLVVLAEASDGLTAHDVFERLAMSVPPTPFERQDSEKSPGVQVYEETVRFSTVEPVKAGWLKKRDGIWRITDKGQEALSEFADPLAFYRAAKTRRASDRTAPLQASDTTDTFAGCFLSLAGAVVGAVVGTVALTVRELPQLDPAKVVYGFVAGFVGGLVAGLIASFAAAPAAEALFPRFGITRAQNTWVAVVAIAATIGAAVTAWVVTLG
jgi:hypothetical protein